MSLPIIWRCASLRLCAENLVWSLLILATSGDVAEITTTLASLNPRARMHQIACILLIVVAVIAQSQTAPTGENRQACFLSTVKLNQFQSILMMMEASPTTATSSSVAPPTTRSTTTSSHHQRTTEPGGRLVWPNAVAYSSRDLRRPYYYHKIHAILIGKRLLMADLREWIRVL